jgi:hypothetical protein
VYDDDRFLKIERHDLKLDVAIIPTDPYQACVATSRRRHPYRIGRVDDVHRVGLADPVAPR